MSVARITVPQATIVLAGQHDPGLPAVRTHFGTGY